MLNISRWSSPSPLNVWCLLPPLLYYRCLLCVSRSSLGFVSVLYRCHLGAFSVISQRFLLFDCTIVLSAISSDCIFWASSILEKRKYKQLSRCREAVQCGGNLSFATLQRATLRRQARRHRRYLSVLSSRFFDFEPPSFSVEYVILRKQEGYYLIAKWTQITCKHRRYFTDHYFLWNNKLLLLSSRFFFLHPLSTGVRSDLALACLNSWCRSAPARQCSEESLLRHAVCSNQVQKTALKRWRSRTSRLHSAADKEKWSPEEFHRFIQIRLSSLSQ